MATITVFGGTGYTGAAIVAEAAARGHDVVSVSRHQPRQPVDGVTYVHRSVTSGDPSSLVASSDAVVGALAPRGDLAGKLGGVYQAVAETAEETGTRFVVIGGFTSLRRAPGGPRIALSEELDPSYAAEAREMATFAEWLTTTPAELDWLYLSPTAAYGSFNPQPARGTYRLGGDVVSADAGPHLAAADLARAVLDLIEGNDHHREHLGVC